MFGDSYDPGDGLIGTGVLQLVSECHRLETSCSCPGSARGEMRWRREGVIGEDEENPHPCLKVQ